MAIEPDELDQSGRGVRLAARCNMSQSKISRVEGNKFRPSLLDTAQEHAR